MKRANMILVGAAIGGAAGLTVSRFRQSRERRWLLAQQAETFTKEAVARLATAAQSRFVTLGELRFHIVEAGPEDGPLAILLHGFPECWYSWRHQIPLLAQAGYRVVVPDQRGYNLSDKPPAVSSYRLDCLTADVCALISTLEQERAVVIGHDWGGVVAWRFAMDYPDSVEKLVVMNAPHPVAYARELGRGWSQRLKSWYALLFQIPWLPEAALSLSPEATARLFFRRTAVRTNAFSDFDLSVMATALAQPGAMRTMIHWYRAARRHRPRRRTQVIDTPTLLVWAKEDVALGLPLTYGLAEWVPNLTLHYIPACGHWVQNEAPETVNAHLLTFLQPAKR